MAHFAKIESNNIVSQVIVIDNSKTLDLNGIESEKIGADFCNKLVKGIWVKTSYNSNIRKNYASIGDTYDIMRDAFISPKPFNSWILNEESCIWEAPTPRPEDDKEYIWSEETTSWVIQESV